MTDRFSGLKFLVFAIICTVITVAIADVIGNWRFGAASEYQATFASAQGLLVNDAVKIAGVTVGKVNDIEVNEDGLAVVSFEVDDDHPITDDAEVFIKWRDVFGLRFLYVANGTGATAEDGKLYGLEQTRGAADLTVLLDRLVPVMTALDPELQNQVLQALAEGLVGRDDEVQAIIADGADLTEAIASRDAQITSLIDDTSTIVEAYSARRDDLQSLVRSFADVAESIAERNDLLVSSVVAVADAQEELDRLLAENDAELRAALDEAEIIAGVLSARERELDLGLETMGDGLVSYHLVSRLGQWFDIAVPGSSSGGETLGTRSGAALPEPDPDGGPATATAAFFSTGS